MGRVKKRDNQIRCPYCNRHLARSKNDYCDMKYCPSCGSSLIAKTHRGFDKQMHHASVGRPACSLEIIAAIAATSGVLQAILR